MSHLKLKGGEVARKSYQPDRASRSWRGLREIAALRAEIKRCNPDNQVGCTTPKYQSSDLQAVAARRDFD